MSYVQTANYNVDRVPRTGTLMLQNKNTHQFMLFQGEDVTILEAELEHCPARLLDKVLGQYEGVLK